ncbi:hypothetical protein CVT26_007513, partial [Gymnopilus dilepis]
YVLTKRKDEVNTILHFSRRCSVETLLHRGSPLNEGQYTFAMQQGVFNPRQTSFPELQASTQVLQQPSSTMFSRSLLTVFAYAAIALALPEPLQDGELVDSTALVTHTGIATWYNPSAELVFTGFLAGIGNCGVANSDNDLVIAISKQLYDKNKGSNCGQYIQITNTDSGKKAYGQVEDSCPGYLSPALFKKLGTLDQGVLHISWSFKNKGWKPGN